MVDDIRSIQSIKNEILDKYLSYGWYRMGHLIFTTHALEPHNNGVLYPVFWLRYLVYNVKMSTKNFQLINKNKKFKISYRQFSLTEELEQLHQAYFNSLRFPTAGNLKDLLNDVENRIYDTYVAEVRDNGKLIAAGIFDLGENSIAGIINFYDPTYKKYSPGKFLMLLKYQFCLENNLMYYYPGYYSPVYPVFDYKLFLDKNATEVLIPFVYKWIPYFEFVKIDWQ